MNALPLPLRALAPAKINLGLFVGPTREDGRHELVSAMQSISLADELTLEPAQAGAQGDEIVCPGFPELQNDNLAARALALFRSATGWEPGALRLTIRKRVPVAAGMGGGSGDAAAALRLAAMAAGVQDAQLLLRLAGELGADVPAQVKPGRWLAQGAGERLLALAPPAKAFGVLVLPLDAGLSTARVYAQADRLGSSRTAQELAELAERLRRELADGRPLPSSDLLGNDLQEAAISLCPEIRAALRQAREAGADTALVSGSGPTVLGLFEGGDGLRRAVLAAEKLERSGRRAVSAAPVDGSFAGSRPLRNND